ncbi:hypothetical protein KJ359_004467 [Pestalotiopsis sp. 9143b]|nr:hypothetical protein KJ359_004467 [Pestalotiopsis sp. 9143b]
MCFYNGPEADWHHIISPGENYRPLAPSYNWILQILAFLSHAACPPGAKTHSFCSQNFASVLPQTAQN